MIKENSIAGKLSAKGNEFFQSVNPSTREKLPEKYAIATDNEIDIAAKSAYEAWHVFKQVSGEEKSIFLNAIADEIENLGDELIEKVMEESGLPEGRVRGERGRTCNQLRLFAELVNEGSWVNALIDTALPERKPLPRSDIRKMSMALGPVAVFTASNFPLAFSTAGGDTASALAAGCPVIVKGHPSHPGTNYLIAGAITKAAKSCKLPAGVFSSLNGGIAVGEKLIQHPLIKAIGFTGSYKGGMAITNIANNRNEPIPAYCEMGSNNPIFILPNKLKEEQSTIANQIANSVNLGAGQFCTNPGIIVLKKDENSDGFLDDLKQAFDQLVPSVMLNEGIYNAYNSGKDSCMNLPQVLAKYSYSFNSEDWKANPSFATINATEFINNKALQTEVFGPFTLVVLCENSDIMLNVADSLHGQLTATIMGKENEIIENRNLSDVLAEKVGRLIYNGVPTGVEVSPAMHHGGPFPSTSNALFTSVGTDAIKRFARPVCFQDAPESILPMELKNENPFGIWRTVNGKLTR